MERYHFSIDTQNVTCVLKKGKKKKHHLPPSKTNWRSYLVCLIHNEPKEGEIRKYNWLIALQFGFISLTLMENF